MPKSKLISTVTGQYRNRVRKCRLQAMVTRQEDLAGMTGISRSVISALENNRIFLSSPFALLISEVLGCPLDELYEKRQKGVARSNEGVTRTRMCR